jgi:MMPL family
MGIRPLAGASTWRAATRRPHPTRSSATFPPPPTGLGWCCEPRARPPSPSEPRLSAACSAAAELDRLWLPWAGLAPARRDLAGRGVALIPLSSGKSPDQITDVAVELGSELDPGQPVRGTTAYTVGQGAAWAGLQDLSKHDLESAEVTGFPIVALILLFVLTGVPSIEEIGPGCAVAIALDATLVRLILVPAAMQLMGRWNWWIPGWLDRALPDLSFEGRRRAPEPASA